MKIGHCFKARFEFQKRDLWIGLYWEIRMKRTQWPDYRREYNFWICFIPMLPLHISWRILDTESEELNNE